MSSFLRRICPDYSNLEIKEAEENLTGLLITLKGMSDRLENSEKEYFGNDELK